MHLNNESLTLENYLKLGFILIVITLPFQKTPEMYGMNIPGISYIDELAALIGILFICLDNKFSDLTKFPNFSYTLIIFCIAYAFISAIDHVTLFRASFGLFDATKAFLPTIIAYYFSWKERDVIFFIKSITLTAALLSLFGIFFGGIAEITHSSSPLLVSDIRFFGLHRLVSLTGYGNMNYFGIYLILAFFLIPIWESIHIRIILRILVITALVWTGSRQAFPGFFVVLYATLPSKYRVRVLFALMIMLIVAYFSWGIIGKTILHGLSTNPNHYFRLYAFVALWKTFIANPWFGHGPTTAGSLGSIIFDSSFYSDWPRNFRDMVFDPRGRGVDQYWMAILAETGIVGTIAYFMVFIKLRKEIVNAYEWVGNIGSLSKWRYIGQVLSGYMIVIWIMGLAGGLNSAFVVWTYFGLSGAYLSYMIYKQKEDQKKEEPIQYKIMSRYNSMSRGD